MKINELINGIDVINIFGQGDIEIEGIAYDSRKVKKNYIFVCIDGTTIDGHKFAGQAIESGATALMVTKKLDLPDDVCQILVSDARAGLATLAANFYGHPSTKLSVVGVTGTKGKTTVTFMVKAILEAAKRRVGLIGTISNMIADKVLYTSRTTPESLDLQSLFCEMLDEKINECVMEVSSQGLMLHRVTGTKFKLGVFTNIEHDHIGPNEHSDFDDYLNQKLKLFAMSDAVIINRDTALYERVSAAVGDRQIFTYGIENEADLVAKNIVAYADRVEFTVVGNEKFAGIKAELTVSVPGMFNISNALAAIAITLQLGIDAEAIKLGLSSFSVKGRTEIVASGNGYTAMIDYAHNAMALESLLKSVREYAKGRIVCMFGCGGNRDRQRRFEMGEVSGKYADFTIITSDNPRNEEPAAIINDIETGIKKTDGKYIKIENRKDAMEYAIKNAIKDDIIIFAGKGHETYQIFKDETIHFDEREVISNILTKLGQS